MRLVERGEDGLRLFERGDCDMRLVERQERRFETGGEGRRIV